MKQIEKIDTIGWLILFVCFGITYCLILLIFKPFDYDWGIVSPGIIFGTFDLIVLLYIYIRNIFYKEKELDEREKSKTWIDRVCEKGF